MADDRAEQIARIEQIERIKALESKRSGSDPAQPSAAAIGSPDGKTGAEVESPDWVDRLKQLASGAQAAISKSHIPILNVAMNPGVQEAAGRVLSVPGGIARTLAADGLEALAPGKNDVTLGDYGNAALGQAPGVGDQVARKFPEVDSASMDIPGTNGKKLSARDLMNFVGNTALDPLVHGMGQAVGKGMYDSSIGKIIGEGKRFGKDSVGETYNKYGIKNPLTMDKTVQAAVDKNMLATGATEAAATRLPGSDIDVAKAMEPAQAHVNAITKYARGDSAQEAMAEEMQKEIDNHKSTISKEPQKAFVELPYTEPEQKLVYAGPNPESELHLGSGESTGRLMQNTVTPRLDAKGKPVVNSTPLKKMPGERLFESNPENLTPGGRGGNYEINRLPVPGNYDIQTNMIPKLDVGEATSEPDLLNPKTSIKPSPLAGSQWKTDAYAAAKDAAYDTAKKTTAWQGFYKSLGYGLKEATEKAIEKTLGSEAAEQYRKTNADTGNLLSTKRAQINAQAQAERLKASVTTPITTGTEGAAGGLAAALKEGDPLEKLGAFTVSAGLQKLAKGAQLGAMPAGYALRNMPQAPLNAAIIGTNLKPSPWAIGDDNGKK